VLNWFIRSDIRVHPYPSEKMILNPLSSEEPKLFGEIITALLYHT
jgi:hypothetical protein